MKEQRRNRQREQDVGSTNSRLHQSPSSHTDAQSTHTRSPDLSLVLSLHIALISWLMDALKITAHYLANLEWTEKKQEHCKFCDPANLGNPIYEVRSTLPVPAPLLTYRAHAFFLGKIYAGLLVYLMLRCRQDETLLAIENIRKAGEEHWLILPKASHARHIRDIEALTQDDLPLCEQESLHRANFSSSSL